MSLPQYTEPQIRKIIAQYDLGIRVADVCQRHGISPATLHKWRRLYGESKAKLPIQLQETIREMATELSACQHCLEKLTVNKQQSTALVGLPTLQGITCVPVADIIYCKGESSQTSVFMSDKKRHMINRTLKQCEEALGKLGFCRIHKSYLINLMHLKKFKRGQDRSVELAEGIVLEVTKRYQEELLSCICRL